MESAAVVVSEPRQPYGGQNQGSHMEVDARQHVAPLARFLGQVVADEAKYVLQTYAQPSVVFVRGEVRLGAGSCTVTGCDAAACDRDVIGLWRHWCDGAVCAGQA